MIRITRLIKKDSLDKILLDKNISKIVIRTYVQNLENPNFYRIYIHLKIKVIEWNQFIQEGLNTANNLKLENTKMYETLQTTLNMAKCEGVLREASFKKFNNLVLPSKTMKEFINKYTQEYFNNL